MVFWRPNTKQTKYPEPAELLRLFRRLTDRFCQEQPRPPVEDMEEPWASEVADVMSYGSKELQDLVGKARMIWFALPCELADSFSRCQEGGFQPVTVAAALPQCSRRVPGGRGAQVHDRGRRVAEPPSVEVKEYRAWFAGRRASSRHTIPFDPAGCT